MPRLLPALALTSLSCLLAFIGGSACTMKQTAGVRDSGQSHLMDETFAGTHACDPEDHSRPFIIEWDATDMSSFESLAANDMIIVKYDGCKLRVIDECRNDSIRGSQGAYKPPEWTSGSLETIDIHNEGELYAKLPLGKATLGGRVSGGERFHMEYFVAGTVYATRDAVYTEDLAANPGCEGATHFVYGYNLGAFALGSFNETEASTGVSVYGYGGGGGKSSGYAAEKKGGDLTTCQSDSATEVRGCKTPIRLNLRKIRAGANPDVEAMHDEDSDESLNAAGQVDARLDAADDARSHEEAAKSKAVSGDGAGCLEELDIHDELDPKHKSTDPKSHLAMTRAQCVMISGRCDAGKAQASSWQQATAGNQQSPEQIERHVEALAMIYCQGKMSERDQLLQAHYRLQQSLSSEKDLEFCATEYKRAMKVIDRVKPKDDNDVVANIYYGINGSAPRCFVKAGDCGQAYTAYVESMPPNTRAGFDSYAPKEREERLHQSFLASYKSCVE